MERGIITFDCYGTLIDWETGIRNVFQQLVPDSQKKSRRIFDLYDEEERRVEKLPYRSYAKVMSEAMSVAASRAGISNVPKEKMEHVATDIPSWKPFSDTNPSLEKLERKYDLGILSNIDNDLLAGTRKHFTVDFQFIVTAENVRSYKPAPAHFKTAVERIGNREWVHVAGSLYHDIQPASELGISSVWVNRKHAEVPIRYVKYVKRQVPDLAQLVQMLM